MNIQKIYTDKINYAVSGVEVGHKAQNAIDKALRKNVAVGIAGGCYDEELTFIFVCDYLIYSLGYKNFDELMVKTGGKFINLICDNDKELFDSTSFLNGKSPKKYRIKAKDGTPMWVSEFKVDTFDASGKPMWIATLRNIDAVYRREYLMKRQSIDLADTLLALTKMYLKVLKVNLTDETFVEARSDIKQRKKNNTQGKKNNKKSIKISDWTKNYAKAGNIHEDDVDLYLEFCNVDRLKKLFKAGEKSLLCRYRRLVNGEFRWVKMEIVPSAEYTDEKQMVVLSILDIEDDIRKERDIDNATKLAASANISLKKQTEITNALGSFYSAIYSLDLEKNKYEQIVTSSFSGGTVIPKVGKIDDLMKIINDNYVTDEYKNEMKEFLCIDTLGERLADTQIISKRFEGTVRGWCRDSFIVEHRTEDGRITNVTFTSQDINDEVLDEMEKQKMLRKAVEEAERANAAKSDFLSRMSHDIRTPINGIMGMLEIIKNNRDDDERIDDSLNKITISVNYLLSLVNDVLDMSKLESGDIMLTEESFDIRELVDSCCQIEQGQANNNNISIHTDIPEKIKYPRLIGSPLHIRHILLNIMSNCVKYNKPSGDVFLSMEEMDAQNDIVGVKIVIRDTGIGMSAEFLRHIFEAFTQEEQSARTTFQGTGLGMAIVKKLVDKIGGEIHVESRPDVGTTFTLILPLKIDISPSDNAMKVVDEAEGDINISGIHILLVEDNEINLEIARYILEEKGAKITTAENGQIAVSEYSKAPEDFDVILMDIMMPVMNGIEAAKNIRKIYRKKEIPIIAMTANAFDDDVKRCKDAGMNDHVAKPIDPIQLMLTLQKWIS